MIRSIARNTAKTLCALGIAALVTSGAAKADPVYTTIDLSGYVNGQVDRGASTFPTGITTGNEGTTIPFDIASSNGVAQSWNPAFGSDLSQSLTVDLSSYDISGQATFYALLNNYYGTIGADEYDITITASNGDTQVFQSIGGLDTRDYNASGYSNMIANTTSPWFANYDLQSDDSGQRLDVREFALDAQLQSDTLSSFTITPVTVHDSPLLTGLTFSDGGEVDLQSPSSPTLTQPSSTTAVPEPSSMAVLLSGAFSLIAWKRRGRPTWRGGVPEAGQRS